jgi:Ran GTPase-activating protein (RanGAP) involved in mRNA processing and transport
MSTWLLAFALHAFRALTHLDVSQNELSEHGAQDLVARLGAEPALRSLELINCVRANDVRALSGGLARCAGLARFRLTYNIECPAATEHARALRACSALTLLDLTGNSLHCAGAAALARDLERCPALADLRLPFNYVGFLGESPLCEPFVSGVFRHHHATSTHLTYTHTPTGAAVLLEASARCPALADLDLSNNVLGRARPASNRFCTGPQKLTSFSFERLHHAAGQCTALRSLSLAYNYFSDPEKAALVDRWGPQRPGLALQNE